MNWNIIIAITIFIVDVILAWFCYTLGCRTVKPIKINNDQLLEQKRALEDDILYLFNRKEECEERNKILDEQFNSLGKEIYTLNQQKELIEKSNQQAQEFIAQSEQLASEKADALYEKKCSELEHEYQVYKRDLQSIIDWNKDKIQKQENELKSLQETRAAAITAAQKEKQIQENKNDYCLILPREESSDVEILRGVIKKIAKPRSILMAIWQAYYAPIAKKKFPKILGKTDACGIYKITNQETGECYIGQAVDVRRRWMDHCKAGLGIDTPRGNQLYAAMQEYGLDSFSFELLLECEPNQLNEKEKYFITLYNSDAIGYNGNKGVG